MRLNDKCVPGDQKQRDEIVSLTGENIFVEASAGSGKTRILVDRMAAMVLEGIDIRKVSAITYTKAAAKEFYERFQRKLSELAEKETDPTRLSYLTKASEDIDLCFMGTIDAFCSTILSEHPIKAGVPMGAHVLEEGEYTQAIQREYQAIARGEYGPQFKADCDKYVGLIDEPQHVFCIVMSCLLDHPDNSAMPVTVMSAEELQKKCAPLMLTFNKILDFIKTNSTNISKTANFQKFISQDRCAENPDACSATGTYISDHLVKIISEMRMINDITIKGDIRSMTSLPEVIECFIPSKASKKWEDDLALDPFKKFPKNGVYKLDMLECDCETAFKVLNEQKYAAAMEFCLKAYPYVEQKLKQRGDLNFSTVLYYLRNMLREDTKKGGKLIKHISARHSYFLIDEFQDTDPIQSEIFFYLAAEDPVEKWDKCRARKGSLFIVGDPKQSIYSFKGSDERQFCLVRDKFTKSDFGKVIEMTFNFRSSYKLCGWFDEKFKSLFGSKYNEILTYADPKSIVMPAPDVLDGCWSLSANSCGENETLELIRKIVNNPSYKIDADPPRCIDYKDIMIITVEKKETDTFAKKLKDAGIPVKVEGSVDYSKNLTIGVVSKLMAVAADTYDNAALYSLLKSSLFGFTDERLAAVSWGDTARKKGFIGKPLREIIFKKCEDKETKSFNYKYLDNKTDADLIAAADIINAVRTDAYNMPAAAVMLKAADDLKLLAKMGSKEMQLFYSAVEIIRSREISGEITSLKQAAAVLESLINSKPKDNDRSLELSETPNAVHIANMHKVKGLQRPIVILGIKSKNTKHPINNALVYYKGERRNVIFSVTSSKTNNSTKIIYSPALEHLKEIAKGDILDEHKRQNYVAATRAENALFICHHPTDNEDPDMEQRLTNYWKALSLDDNANVLEEFSFDKVPDAPKNDAQNNGEQLYADAQTNSSLNNKQDKLKPTYTFDSPNEKKLGSRQGNNAGSGNAEPDNDDQTAQADPIRFASIRADNKGSLAHRLMELLVLSRTTAAEKIDKLIKQVIDELGLPLNETQLAQAKQMLELVADTMLNGGGFTQAGKAPQDLLGELADDGTSEIFCELPICYESNGAIVYGIIDLMYVKNGKWHIIDYKTDRDANEAVVKHAPQLEAYRQAVIKLKGVSENDIDANVYNVNIN